MADTTSSSTAKALTSTKSLLDRIDKQTSAMLRHYIALLQVDPSSTSSNDPEPAVSALPARTSSASVPRRRLETEELVRAAEALLTLTRGMREAWVFGGAVQRRADGSLEGATAVAQDARAVLGELRAGLDAEVSGGAEQGV